MGIRGHACSFPEVDLTRDEQSREERLEIARRYRERRGRELKELAAGGVDGEVVAAGEFSAAPQEAMAAIPFVGIVMLPWARWRARRAGLPLQMLIALTGDEVHLLEYDKPDLRSDDHAARAFRTWPRAAVRVGEVRKAFMRTVVTLDVPDAEEPLTLYAPSLRTNPWSAEVVRLLGGDAPDPLDLSA